MPGIPENIIIGIGNSFRSDDAAGLLIARRLPYHLPIGWTVIEESGEGASLMESWSGMDHVIIIDACLSGGEPGSLYEFCADKEEIPVDFFHYSTHQFGVAECIETARKLNKLPPKLKLFGIEGASFDYGEKLSPKVELALDNAVDKVLKYVRSGVI